MSGVLVVAEQRDGELKKVTMEMVGKATALGLEGDVQVVLLGNGVSDMATSLGGLGLAKAYLADDPALENYQPELYAEVLAALAGELQPELILMAATSTGRDLAPKLAAKIGAGLAADCTDLSLEDGALTAVRPIYAGKALAKVVFKSDLKMVSLRPNVLPAPESSGNDAPPTESLTVPSLDLKAQVTEILKQEGDQIELTEADVIVSGGRGLKGPEHFQILKDLAKELNGAAVGASRSAVDEGWIDHSHQVGQTGKTVNPTLYIACGISGAIQHLAGMRNSKVIVAVNKDPEAPIFNVADYGVVGDLFEVVPALTEEIKKLN